ncbi:MAG TPA: type II secretion system protein [Burkholderiales bacterium]|jgi:prepilin-type N-terminal cleavage/methylation domain-containing protein|nr:type II secretion system protein [Burkholderiales bacterium]
MTSLNRSFVSVANSPKGFTLVELAIGMLVIALLLGSILVPLSAQVEQRKVAETQKVLEETREALLGFAVTQGYLPCPAVSAANGDEDRSAGTCTGGKRQGFVPWALLGTPKLDAWGHIFRYSVSPTFSTSVAPFSLASTRDITIRTRDSSGALTNLSNLNAIPAVVLSVGKNGYWGTIDNGTNVGDKLGTPDNVDEDTNGNGSGQVFVSRTITDNANATGGEWDDIVIWLSPNVLFNRMVAAGKLP